MKLKEKRQEKILQIIEMYDIETQEDLTGYLMREGFRTTQATVSRDIKELHLVKVLNESNRYRYSQASAPGAEAPGISTKLQNLMKDSVIKITIAQNLVILKCFPGTASATCAAIDSLDDIEVAGTIAGDDTVFVAAYDDEGAYCISARMHNILGREML